jgi:hypothetical protein
MSSRTAGGFIGHRDPGGDRPLLGMEQVVVFRGEEQGHDPGLSGLNGLTPGPLRRGFRLRPDPLLPAAPEENDGEHEDGDREE